MKNELEHLSIKEILRNPEYQVQEDTQLFKQMLKPDHNNMVVGAEGDMVESSLGIMLNLLGNN